MSQSDTFNKAYTVNVTLIEKQSTLNEQSQEKPTNQGIVYKVYCFTFCVK